MESESPSASVSSKSPTQESGVMFITAYGKQILCMCQVRNELNGRRKADEIIYTMGDVRVPYMPRTFPIGNWRLYHPLPKEDQYMAPYFIPTDAWQNVEEWKVENGKYVGPTGRIVKDAGYGLHFSTSKTTFGCIRIMTRSDLIWLAKNIADDLNAGCNPMIEILPP